jgi:hypothetical protein
MESADFLLRRNMVWYTLICAEGGVIQFAGDSAREKSNVESWM